jgi:hypothetical protein
VTEFLSIAWPGLLALAGLLAFVAHGVRNHRRTQRGRYRYSSRKYRFEWREWPTAIHYKEHR